jgi:hypothetical protein
MMGDIFAAIPLSNRTYTMWSDIPQYSMNPDEVAFVLFDFFAESDPSPKCEWSGIHEPYTSQSSRIASIAIDLYLLAEMF